MQRYLRAAIRILCLLLVSHEVFAGAPTFRLPAGVLPIAYRADLTLDPQAPRFTGLIAIDARVAQPTHDIWLNAVDLQITKAEVIMGGKSYFMKAQIEDEQFLSLHSVDLLPVGAAEIRISYSGKIVTGATAGIFQNTDAGNKYLLTQFESTDARRALPCFDEPGYKTPWQLTLRVPEGQLAVSNTPVASQRAEGKQQVFVFAPTKPLPSYLVAFAVGPFEFVDAGSTAMNHAPIRIVVPKGRRDEAKYAAQVTPKILSALEDYFGIPYPYEKSDQVVVPVSYGFGAMENAGMVTYQQTLLLSGPQSDSIQRQRNYVRVAAHELAHQWFGDYVTPQWWDDIWLNEAFATWMSTKIVSELQPQWGDLDDAVDSKANVEAQDTLISARKIHEDVKTESDIANGFDGITYQKGAAVIAMFEQAMGPELFRASVRQYMKTHAYGNANTADFLAALDHVKPVSRAFRTFIDQAGVPVVSVDLKCDAGGNQVALEQQRLLPLGSMGSQGSLWAIPFCMRIADEKGAHVQCAVLDQPSMSVPIGKPGDSCPLSVDGNAGATGYYLPLYSRVLFDALDRPAPVAELSAGERVDLLASVQLLADSGRMPMRNAYLLVELLHDDPSRQVVARALNVAIDDVEHRVSAQRRVNFEHFIDKNFGNRARQLGWHPVPGEPEDTALLRAALVGPVARYGNEKELIAQARQMTTAWLAKKGELDPLLGTEILSTAAYAGNADLADAMISRLVDTDDKQTRARLLRALSRFRDPGALKLIYGAVLDDDIPLIEGSFLLFAGNSEPATRNLSFENIRAHYDEIIKKRPIGADFDFAAFLPHSAAQFCDVASRNAAQQFFDGRTTKFNGGQRELAQVLEGIDLCIARKSAQQGGVENFMMTQ